MTLPAAKSSRSLLKATKHLADPSVLPSAVPGPAPRARSHLYLVGEEMRSLGAPAAMPGRTTIRINGRWHAMRGRSATFAQLLQLAYPDQGFATPIAATVSYRGGPGLRPNGVMKPGDVIEIADGLVVNADATYAS